MMNARLDFVTSLLQVRDGHFGFLNNCALAPAQTVDILLRRRQVCFARRLLLSLVTPLLEGHLPSEVGFNCTALRSPSTP